MSPLMMPLVVTLLCMLLGSSWAQAPSLYPAPCDAQSTEKAARLAITAINEDRREGYKLSLNRINKAVVHDQKVSGICSVTLYEKPQAPVVLHNYNCVLTPDTKEDVTSICPDCLILIDVNSSEATHALGLSLLKFNAMSNESNHYASAQVIRAASLDSSQEDLEYHLEFIIKETNCVKEYDLVVSNCTFKSPARTGFCVSDVYVEMNITVDVSCDLYDPQEAEETQKYESSVGVHGGSLERPKASARGRRKSKERVKHRSQTHRQNFKKHVRPRYRKKDDSSESDSSEEGRRTFTTSKKHSKKCTALPYTPRLTPFSEDAPRATDLPPSKDLLPATDLPLAKELPQTKDFPPAKELPQPKDLPPIKELPPSKELPQPKDLPPTKELPLVKELPPIFFETFPDLPPHVQTCPGEPIHLIL
ncbi:alpha-2-HS-glycoprotein-like isoform X2 [Rhinatrema bivittatum]|uniref:alpha-2-HS-glycoprotein-like isoform X2 n=1 Tax=Rhinatrema bivittatum TaxID=194408 RepID=UPI00112D8F09|nr:alpha-2-HS-glycoprotein-like isoform X2 [Rhinatrema bivittatum]